MFKQPAKVIIIWERTKLFYSKRLFFIQCVSLGLSNPFLFLEFDVFLNDIEGDISFQILSNDRVSQLVEETLFKGEL